MVRSANRLPGRSVTADVYFSMPEDGRRYELVEGELREMSPAPTLDVHQFTLQELFLSLSPFIRANQLGWLWFAPADVIFSAHDVFQPDLFFVQQSRAEIIGARLYGPPDLVIEVTSPSTAAFDRGQKLARYEHFGVRWYWIVDPIAHTVEELEWRDGKYVHRSLPTGNDPFNPGLFPGLTIDLTAIWPDPELGRRESLAGR